MSRAEKDLMNLYATEERQSVYIACEKFNFVWDEKELRKFKLLWNGGYSLVSIAERLKRDINEVAFLIIDLAEEGEIKKRKTGVYGIEI